MQEIFQWLERFPGRRMRREFFKRSIPPLWLWLRAGFFFGCGALLMTYGIRSYGRILMTLAVLQMAGSVLSVFFQESAKAIQRYFEVKQRKKNGNDADD